MGGNWRRIGGLLVGRGSRVALQGQPSAIRAGGGGTGTRAQFSQLYTVRFAFPHIRQKYPRAWAQSLYRCPSRWQLKHARVSVRGAGALRGVWGVRGVRHVASGRPRGPTFFQGALGSYRVRHVASFGLWRSSYVFWGSAARSGASAGVSPSFAARRGGGGPCSSREEFSSMRTASSMGGSIVEGVGSPTEAAAPTENSTAWASGRGSSSCGREAAGWSLGSCCVSSGRSSPLCQWGTTGARRETRRAGGGPVLPGERHQRKKGSVLGSMVFRCISETERKIKGT